MSCHFLSQTPFRATNPSREKTGPLQGLLSVRDQIGGRGKVGGEGLLPGMSGEQLCLPPPSLPPFSSHQLTCIKVYLTTHILRVSSNIFESILLVLLSHKWGPPLCNIDTLTTLPYSSHFLHNSSCTKVYRP